MTLLFEIRDWQQSCQQMALKCAGTPEADIWLSHAKRYGLLADEIERLRKVADAARCIRHWHDSANGGMVVSGEHVMALWQALHELDESPNASGKPPQPEEVTKTDDRNLRSA